MARKLITITYDGKPNSKLEGNLASAMLRVGFRFRASGYNVKTDIRDLSFESVPIKDIKCQIKE